jgi:hypothetical protein
LLQTPPELVSTVTAPALLLALNTLANQQLLAISGTPVCDIAVHHIRYTTGDRANEATTASGALMVLQYLLRHHHHHHHHQQQQQQQLPS